MEGRGYNESLPSISTIGFWTLTLSTAVTAEAKQRTEGIERPVESERRLLKETPLNRLEVGNSGNLGFLKVEVYNDDGVERSDVVAAMAMLCRILSITPSFVLLLY